MSDEGKIISLRTLLEEPSGFPVEDFLFVERGSLTLESSCLVDPADLYDVDYVPPLAIANNMKYCIMMSSFSEIIDNLNIQVANPNLQQKFEALLYFIENDAFKEWT